MDWVKKNYDQVALLLVSLVLLGCSVVLILNALGFHEIFKSIQGQVAHSTKIEKVDTSKIEAAQAALQQAAVWSGHEGSLFVSRKYTLKEGELYQIGGKPGETLNPPIPDDWFAKFGIDPLQAGVLDDDPDGDGFTNLEEFAGGVGDISGKAATNPSDKASHPPYWTKLRLRRFIKKPFLVLFASYDGDASKPDSLTFQINAITAGKASQFLKLNDNIAGTKFKLTAFAEKKFTDANGVVHDVSELTLQNAETGGNLTLVLGKIADSPDSYGLFRYLWDNSEFQVKKDQSFSLKPEADVQYKLVDIKDTEALIENLKSHEQIKVPKFEEIKR